MTNKSFDHENHILPRKQVIETHPLMVKMQNRSATLNASMKQYEITREQAVLLKSGSGDEEKQHRENGYLILKKFVHPHCALLQQQFVFYIGQLSASRACGLLESGLQRWN